MSDKINLAIPININQVLFERLILFARILLLPSIGSLFIIIPLPELKVWYYLCPMSVLASFISFVSIPFLSDYLHSKALHYDDLLDNNIPPGINNEKLRKKYQKLYKILLYIVSSLLMSILIYYLTFQFHDSTLDWLEFIGILGGWLSLTKKFFETTSNILLKIVYQYKVFLSPSLPPEIPNIIVKEVNNIQPDNLVHPDHAWSGVELVYPNNFENDIEMSSLNLKEDKKINNTMLELDKKDQGMY
jgi:hypothetical protein